MSSKLENSNFNSVYILLSLGISFSYCYKLFINPLPDWLIFTNMMHCLGLMCCNIFFGISGFLFYQNFIRNSSITNSLIKLFTKLLPALLACNILIIGSLTILFFFEKYFVNQHLIYLKDDVHSISINSYLYNIFNNKYYTKVINESFWMIPVEIISYLKLIILGSVILKVLTKIKDLPPKYMHICIVSMCIIYTAYVYVNCKTPNDYDAFQLELMFVLGMISSLSTRYIRHNILWLIILLASVFSLHNIKIITNYYNMLLCIVLCFVLSILIKKRIKFKYDISYGIYLYVFPVVQTIAYLFPDLNAFDGLLIAIPITVILAFLSYKYIEKPLLNLTPSIINCKNHTINFIKKKIRDIFFDYRIFEELSYSRLNDRIYYKNSPLSPFVQIDISIVTFNSKKWINLFFDSLLKQKYPLKMINIFVVDNSSTDNTLILLNSYFEDKIHLFNSVKIITQPNLGFGAGNDAAINLGSSKYILVTNIDGNFEENSILNVVTMAENDFMNVASWELRQKPYEHPKYYDPVTLETSWSSHASILIRREAYLAVKGYEKKIFMYGEDVEISYRFRDAGYKLKYCPSASFIHYTYEDNFFKPLQYIGSISANILLRIRYGKFLDLIFIVLLYIWLLVRVNTSKIERKLLWQNSSSILKDVKFYFSTRKKSENIIFTFNGFDYALNREGEFITSKNRISSPLVSIIMRSMPTRDFDLTKQSIMTIANQTYNNIELIFVEDGSNFHQNNLIKLCNDLALNFKYIHSEKVGRSGAGNQGLANANGDYLMFLDDDDYLFADHIETIMANLLPVQDKYVAAYTLAFEAIVDKNSKIFACKNLHVIQAFKRPYSYYKLREDNLFPIQAIIFKKNLFIERGGFDTTIDYFEDWNLWCRYGFENNFLYIPKTTSVYTITSNRKDFMQRADKMKEVSKEVKYKTEIAISNIKDFT